ncbi:hypothetical protein JCM10908_001562 [Rhodotorula pacifica]|uniref:uncharacterized protein n=1 Tax=Rhodotorula pacifica TaxID=1495444 RepID=UPI00317E0817
MARRASTGTAVTSSSASTAAKAIRSAPPVSRERRSGSLGSAVAHSGYPSNVGDATAHAFPPSSSYMVPLGGVGPASTFRFGSATSVVAPAPTMQAGPARHIVPASRSGSISGAASGTYVAQPHRPPSPFSRPVSALAASTDRMSIHHLTSAERDRAPPPPSSSASQQQPRFEMPRATSEIRTIMPTSAVRRSTPGCGNAAVAHAEGSAARRSTA